MFFCESALYDSLKRRALAHAPLQIKAKTKQSAGEWVAGCAVRSRVHFDWRMAVQEQGGVENDAEGLQRGREGFQIGRCRRRHSLQFLQPGCRNIPSRFDVIWDEPRCILINAAVPAHLACMPALFALLRCKRVCIDDICVCERFRMQLAMSTVSDSCAALTAD
jgi:hypothetical protein